MTATAPPRTSHAPGWIVATGSIITVAFMGSVIVTPLYSVYQSRYGFSEITLTLIYATYVVGNVAALLLFGQVSDQLGRRRVSLLGLGLAAASGLVFLLAAGPAWLYAGRLLSGLAVGILSGTGTAWVAELVDPGRGASATVYAAVANLTGIALGPPLGGLLVQHAPRPLRTPFVVYLLLVAVVAAVVTRIPQPASPKVGRIRDVRVRRQLGVPRDRLADFAAPAVSGFVVFSLGGAYFALIPGIVIRDLHVHDLSVGGLIVGELALAAIAVVVLGQRLSPETAMLTGIGALLPALVLLVTAQAAGSMPLLLLATAFGGVSLGIGYRGSLQVVNGIAPPDHRAEIASAFFISCFLGNALPVIGIGLLTQASTSLTASVVFAVVIGALAVAAALWHRARSRVAR